MDNNSLLPMAPHTAAKHLLLKRYLDCWFPILGRYNPRLRYIDGFAGPGEYRDRSPGSPIIAINSAKQHLENKTIPENIEIQFTFIESDRTSVEHLHQQIMKLEIPPQILVEIIEGKFTDQIGGILDKIEADTGPITPTFAFVDPFGFSGIPLKLMQRILTFPKCEVFINIMVDFINRFLEHPNPGVVKHMIETFGTNEVLEIAKEKSDRKKNLIDLYRSQLGKKAKYIGRFDMRNKADRQLFTMFFASNSARGFEKMKEANWSVDKLFGSQFSDMYGGGQIFMFDAVDFGGLISDLQKTFNGQVVPISNLKTFVIEETDFLPKHLRKALDLAIEDHVLEVVPVDGYRLRRGVYPDGKVEIRFPDVGAEQADG